MASFFSLGALTRSLLSPRPRQHPSLLDDPSLLDNPSLLETIRRSRSKEAQ
ncbi:hypothetical protein Scep_007706 [Stephania cephalantha]|uniref:Uncharacterized protein n=1 Tax=Stephania cephalantha TaxID=152367 RepID=A0AAP0KC43_9MAGN